LSILLESLNQQENKNQAVPDVHSVHFDEDMLGDDWLRRRVRRWQIIASVLLLALILSWSYWLAGGRPLFDGDRQAVTEITASVADKSLDIEFSESSLKEPEFQEPELKKSGFNNAEMSDSGSPEATPRELDIQGRTQSESLMFGHQQESKTIDTRQSYKPEKRVQAVSTPLDSRTRDQSPENLNAVADVSKIVSDESASMPVLLEDLPEKTRQKLAMLSVSSSVVADKAEESFIIIDGRFYQINQQVTPEILIKQIKKSFLVVEYQGQLIKLNL